MNEEKGVDDWFAEEMGKVEPLKSEKNRAQSSKKRTHEILRNLEDKDAHHQQFAKQTSLSVKRTETWLLQADGVATKDIKKLSQENIKHELDLHGYTQDEAINALTNFISEALTHHIRKICIVHGKGNHSKGKSVLKDATYQWLEFGEFSSHILAVTPALQSKGGACNILLRKQNS